MNTEGINELKQPFCDLLQLLQRPPCTDSSTINQDEVVKLWSSLNSEEKKRVFSYQPLSSAGTSQKRCENPLVRRVDDILKKKTIRWDEFMAAPYSKRHLYTWDTLVKVFEKDSCDVHILLPPKYTVMKNALGLIEDETFEDDGTTIGPFQKKKGLALYNGKPCVIITRQIIPHMIPHYTI